MVEPAELAVATNHVLQEVFRAKGAEANQNFEDMIGHYRSAIVAACDIMSRLTEHDVAEISAAKDQHPNDALHNFLQDEANARAFFEAERQLLKEVGLADGLVDHVVDRCIDFIGSEPSEWGNPKLEHAFHAAKFRVCTSAMEEINNLMPAETSVYSARKVGRIAIKNAIGVTIIVANYAYFGPAEVFFGLSTGYGCSWFTTG